MKIAFVNKPTQAIGNCELTFIDRDPVHLQKALEQHSNYANALTQAGLKVVSIDINTESPDAAFIEDVAIILDEVAIVTSMGTPSRRPEVESISEMIAPYRYIIHKIQLPATIEGGDVLQVGKKVFVGHSSRTNQNGIKALTDLLNPHSYQVIPVSVHGCLHLKTGVTALNEDTFVVNPKWIDTSIFKENLLIEVAENESFAANVLRVGEKLIVNAAYPKTAEKIQKAGFRFDVVDISEFSKAEAGLTCLSLIFND